jgi:chromosome condensin MukBEF MukE localization factor
MKPRRHEEAQAHIGLSSHRRRRRLYFKYSSFRRLRHLDLIIFVWEKASSQKQINPKSAVKRRAIDRTEAANKFYRDQKAAPSTKQLVAVDR